MSERVAMDFDAVGKHLNAMVDDTDKIVNVIAEASKQVKAYNESAVVADMTVETVAEKLGSINEALKTVPESVQELTNTLRKLGEDIQSDNDARVSQLRNVGGGI